jgi:hypothetical protein
VSNINPLVISIAYHKTLELWNHYTIYFIKKHVEEENWQGQPRSKAEEYLEQNLNTPLKFFN